jgi:hypothetical protein
MKIRDKFSAMGRARTSDSSKAEARAFAHRWAAERAEHRPGYGVFTVDMVFVDPKTFPSAKQREARAHFICTEARREWKRLTGRG